VTIGVKGSTDAAIAFLGALQHGSRLVLVTGFSGSEDSASAASGVKGASSPGGSATYSITGYVYVLADSSAAAPTATPAPSK
jgi:hypothetical protein